MMTENPYFRVFEGGIFETENIQAKVVPSSRTVSRQLQPLLNEKWRNYQGKRWPNDEKPSRFRYEGSEVVNGVVRLKVSPSISYKDYITWEHGFTEEYGLEGAPLPIAISTLIETAEGKLIVAKRSASHDYKPEGLSGIGGFVNIKEDSRSDGSPDILRALGRETEEESGLKLNEINLSFTG